MLAGRCLCGAVRYETQQQPKYVFNCYCATCRRESGAGHLTIVTLSDEGFVVQGATKIVAPARAGGGAPIPRTFCPECGTVLFVKPPGMPGHVNLRAGTLEGIVDLKVEMSEFGSHAQPWDLPREDIPQEDWGEKPNA